MHILKKNNNNNQTNALLVQTVYRLKLLNLSPPTTKRHLLKIKLNYHCNSKTVLYEKLTIAQINEP